MTDKLFNVPASFILPALLVLFFVCAPLYSKTNSPIDGNRFTTIEDFESGFVSLNSWPTEDISPNSWNLDTSVTYANSSYSLKLYGNTWKQQFITPIVVDSGYVFEAQIYYTGNPRIQGIGFSDGQHTLFYSTAGSATLDIEVWIPVYQGSGSSSSWNTFQFPIADDWYAFFDTLPVITSVIYINDLDGSASGSIWFDSIRDISSDIPVPPTVSITYNTTFNNRISDHTRDVGIQFNSIVQDPDSFSFNYLWSFGDSLTSTDANPFHLYTVTDDHPYRATLKVTDSTGRWGMATADIDVDPGEGSLPLTLNFVGDTMLARRYDQPGGIIPTMGVNAIFQPTKFMLGDAADITDANLEVVLTDQGVHHPTKSVYYRGNPANVQGLTYAGIDLVSLANNHVIDYGLVGLQQMQTNLTNNGILFSGAGANSYEAYKPAWINKKGLNLAFLRSCDRTGQYNHAEPYLQAGYNKYGFAYMTPYYVSQQINAVRDYADLIVTELHGGSEYSLSPGSGYDKSNPLLEDTQDEEYGYLSDIPHQWDIDLRHSVVDAGADLVIVHHPHILHGLEYYHGVLIAHSLGNYVFDLDYPETMPTMILYADAYEDGFTNFTVKPVFIDAYIPKPATGQLGVYILDYLAMRSRELNTTLIVDKEHIRAKVCENTLDYSEIVSNNTLPLWLETISTGVYGTKPFKLPRQGSISGVSGISPLDSAELRLGAETIWYGNFEDEGSTLWSVSNFSTTDVIDGARSALLNPANGQTSTATISDRCKWYDNTKSHTLHGWIKLRNASNVNIVIRYYNSRTSGILSSENITANLSGTYDWTWFSKELTIPSNAWYYDIRLTATGAGANSTALFDNVGLIEWSPWQDSGQYNSIAYPNNYYWMQLRTPELPKSVNLSFTETSYWENRDRSGHTNAPATFELTVYPNPLYGNGSIKFDLPGSASTKAEIFNLRGQRVCKILDQELSKGSHELSWDGRDDSGRTCGQGVYFVKISQAGRSATAKFLLIK